jgi:hypothetical protein
MIVIYHFANTFKNIFISRNRVLLNKARHKRFRGCYDIKEMFLKVIFDVNLYPLDPCFSQERHTNRVR